MKENSSPLLYDETDGIAFIRMNRPGMKNAINSECWHLFKDYFQTLSSQSHIRALIITGATPGIFSAGVDVHPSDPLISNGPQAIRSVKHVIHAAMDLPEKEALAVEREEATRNIMSDQCIEGISAFLEKRVPKWTS